MTKKSPLQELAEHSWELLPEYGNAGTVREALAEQRGTCLHRSSVIGRKALELGYDAMRRITFGADMIPSHFANYIRPDVQWLYLSTGRKHGDYTAGSGFELDPVSYYASFDGLMPEKLEPGGTAQQAMMVIVPEVSMPYFRGCILARQYLRQAYRLLES